ncbi:16S rRNA (cytosine967-C5)-methyltransferase [Enterococcus sp. PF1-24]|uniref:16S rRNA (cytosine(967)-C(5))-methyltransferase RsmB n=1 Tax=unclassified Enterococcus TaxID=2608891 RepID=UPI0024761C59|nr:MULTISPECIES: 16S rRNA (cytosine(967)-C(5))-methyltransferase RsmB [unclassified Enterococcus]MDH6364288.1 16S rRNA (cytosine967-C5)-methyltransferase [Enterococcus sp. PFB1-1]MDH6401353.1 16S rRNA (cytosine967-C5)-methyltransferase [Enterococcus sp. PF1-24]
MAKRLPKKIINSVRYAALTAIEKVFAGGAYSNVLLNDLIISADLNEKDSRLLTELVYGTISRKLSLDFYLKPFVEKTKNIDDWVYQLLRLSAYQLTYLDKVPAHAVLNEAVEIAKARGNQGIAKFVNGVLRNYERTPRRDFAEIEDEVKRLSVETSLPLWLTKKLVAQLGLAEARQLGLSLLTPSKVSARIDTRRISQEEAVAALAEEEDLDLVPSQVSPYGIVGERGHLASNQLFTYGLLTIQDETSMLVAPTLQLEPQHQVLDACAAPGGKTTHMATFLEAEAGGKITALDIHQHKLKLIEENAQRLHVAEVIDCQALDARQVHETFPPESFDRILVDAPCSGLGLMRRKPDIKYTKKPEDFVKLAAIQLEILESVAPTLKKSGILTYSTCTITEEENQQVLATFLAKHPEFEKIAPITNDFVKERVIDDYITIYPHHFMTDGFFIGCLRKK